LRTSAFVLLSTIATLSVNTHATELDTKKPALDLWSGNYAGLSLGSRGVNGDWTTKSYESPTGNALAFGTAPNANLDSDALYYNVYIGRNSRIQPDVLVGIEFSLGDADNDDTHITIPGASTDAPPDFSYIELESGLEVSLRGRVGYLFTPNLHIYGGLGFVAAEVDFSATCPADTDFCNPSFGTISNSKTKTTSGWIASIGLEGVFREKTFFRLEYSHADYGNVDFSGLHSKPSESFGFAGDLDYSSDTFLLGFGYRF